MISYTKLFYEMLGPKLLLLLRVIQIAAIIVIAHRLSTVRDADTINVFENGKITESGSFNELIEAGGLFSHLTKLQSL